jgi:hypothetical protein
VVATAGEASSANALTVPPGLYDVEVNWNTPTGTPTGFTATVQEQGYLLSDVTHTPVTWQALDDPRAKTFTGAPLAGSGRAFMRGVRITRWYDGVNPNAGVGLTIAGGTTPTITQCQVTFWPIGRAPQFNGLP